MPGLVPGIYVLMLRRPDDAAWAKTRMVGTSRAETEKADAEKPDAALARKPLP
jgi:hypothetical protein